MALNALQCIDARRNGILSSLPEREWNRIKEHLEPRKLKRDQLISESALPQLHVYFPTSAIISLLYVTVDGASTEIAAVGSEGLIGIAVYLGGQTMPARALVQCSGTAFRISREYLNDEFRRNGVLQRVLLLYAQARVTLVAQTAACNRHHSVDQRLSRWLLSSLDRGSKTEIRITHELIGKSLGVRREGVSEAAGRLQRSGIIISTRGCTTVIDRRRLENSSCECYGVVRREHFRLLGNVALATDSPFQPAPPRVAAARSLRLQ